MCSEFFGTGFSVFIYTYVVKKAKICNLKLKQIKHKKEYY